MTAGVTLFAATASIDMHVQAGQGARCQRICYLIEYGGKPATPDFGLLTMREISMQSLGYIKFYAIKPEKPK